MKYLTDEEILDLFIKRDEKAITETERKYGSELKHLIMQKLFNEQDTEECIQDICLILWYSVPKNKPEHLRCYIHKICRRKICDFIRKRTAVKRCCETSELNENLTDGMDVCDEIFKKEIVIYIRKFLDNQDEYSRRIFIMKYMEGATIEYISLNCNKTMPAVKMTLYRMKQRLKQYLNDNDISL